MSLSYIIKAPVTTMFLTQEEMLRTKGLKAAKPLAYDMSAEEWEELDREARAEGRRVFYAFIQLSILSKLHHN